MKKVYGILCTTLALAMALTACGGNGGGAATPAPATPAPATQAPAPESAAPAPESAAPAPEGGGSEVSGDAIQSPILVTTCGQSPGAVMINMVAVQGGFTSANDNTLTAEDFDAGDYKTLIVTTGTSMKGMGAAGTDVDSEIARCEALIKAAKDAGLTIVGAHVEGMARRTDNSDQRSIDSVLALSDVILVVEESDSDGFFSTYAADHDLPIITVKDALEISSILK